MVISVQVRSFAPNLIKMFNITNSKRCTDHNCPYCSFNNQNTTYTYSQCPHANVIWTRVLEADNKVQKDKSELNKIKRKQLDKLNSKTRKSSRWS